MLQEEERTLTRLTHEHALAALDAADANAALQTQEAALAKAQMAAAEKELMALTGRPPAAAELKAMPKYAELLAKRDAALHAAKRQQRKRRALASAEADARRNLAALAEDEAASAALLEAAEAAEREARAAREDRAARERGFGGGVGGGGRRVHRRWTQQLRGDVQQKEEEYLTQAMLRSTSREVDDAVGRLDKLQLRRALKEFRLADPDDDGVLSKEEFREALRRDGVPRVDARVVFDALWRQADVDANGWVDLNEWVAFREMRKEKKEGVRERRIDAAHGGGGGGGVWGASEEWRNEDEWETATASGRQRSACARVPADHRALARAPRSAHGAHPAARRGGAAFSAAGLSDWFSAGADADAAAERGGGGGAAASDAAAAGRGGGGDSGGFGGFHARRGERLRRRRRRRRRGALGAAGDGPRSTPTTSKC